MKTLKDAQKISNFTRNIHKPLVYVNASDEVKVQVTPIFIDDESEPENTKFLWAYQIRIENLSDSKIKLTERHWEITDSDGFVQEVDGEGVVGETPTLGIGDSFEYTSSVVLCTPSGFMQGHYTMHRSDDLDSFTVKIPAFSLDSPYASCVVN